MHREESTRYKATGDTNNGPSRRVHTEYEQEMSHQHQPSPSPQLSSSGQLHGYEGPHEEDDTDNLATITVHSTLSDGCGHEFFTNRMPGCTLHRSVVFWKSALALALLFFSIIVEAATMVDPSTRLSRMNEPTAAAATTTTTTTPTSSPHRNNKGSSSSSASNSPSSSNEKSDDLFISGEETWIETPTYASASHNRHQTSNMMDRSANRMDDDIIIIATIDGSFHGISRSNGSILWKRNGLHDNMSKMNDSQTSTNHHSHPSKQTTESSSSIGARQNHRMRPPSSNRSPGSATDIQHPSSSRDATPTAQKESSRTIEESIFAPLISTSTTSANGRNPSWRTTAVPSVDGRVFLTPGSDHGSSSPGRHPTSSRLPHYQPTNHHNSISELTSTVSIRDLVNTAPFVDRRGRFYVGSRNTVAIAFDSSTGDVLRILNGEDGSLDNFDHDLFESSSSKSSSEKSRNHDTNHSHNVVWAGRVDHSVSIYDARTGEIDVQFSTSEVLSIEDMLQGSSHSNPSSSDYLMFPGPSYAIITTPGGQLAMRDTISGEVEWISDESLDAPVAFALESTTGKSLLVDIVPDAPNLFSEEYLAKDLNRRGSKLYGHHEIIPAFDEETVMGRMNTGQLFALPLGAHSAKTRGAYGRNSKSQELIRYPDRLGQISIPQEIPHDPTHYLPQPPPHAHPEYNQNPRQRGYEPRPSKNRFQVFMAIMTSWIPPAIAFAFVVSFELGRRERAREEKVKMMGKQGLKDSTQKDEISQNDKTSKATFDDNKQVGVIQLSDQVLGFGGHGTVVYKGKLDGRHVAVKRMLKAYHASAEREISLLIESDGHPNVVRYFLKESRGDFVYLALELCDMTLQDLIVSLSKQKVKNALNMNVEPLLQNSICSATRRALFDIALGVKHIHSLRIVHRDLKPQNILLAKKATKASDNPQELQVDIVEYFQSEQYVPKISDMGLGKQLTAHSSFGLSTMNQSAGAVQDGSTIAGAGPGSVGWQAPEVMAQRLSQETSHYGSMLGQQDDAMVEASPVETSLNGRTSRSVDIFSLGCIFYCTIVPGAHPFGEWFEREANIMKNTPSIDVLENMSHDASDLIRSMIDRNPNARPTASQVVYHPFFWTSMKRLAFLCDVSDRLEADNNSSNTAEERNDGNSSTFDCLLIEQEAATIVGTAWDTKLDPTLFNNVSKFRSYDQSSVRDCLRLIRNKHHHFDELPQDLKDRLMPSQEGLLRYFEHQFPRLLMHCYNVCRKHLNADDPLVMKYDIPVKTLPRRSKGLTGNIQNSLAITRSKESVIIWENSDAAASLNCRGWMRSEDEWIRKVDCKLRKREKHLTRCVEDPKYRTRLCNWWDKSQGTYCAMRKKNKCVFAHGPVELRVKEGKKNRWGKLVDKNGNNSNPFHSGGEDTYGAARSIESARKVEGKWKTDGKTPRKGKQKKANNNSSE